jgi:hypothetical protein
MLAGCGGSQPPIGAPLFRSAASVYSHHRTFRYTGARQMFTVPGGVTEIQVIAIGGNGAPNYGNGGYGGRVSAVIPVATHESLWVFVGGDAYEAKGGFNGGGHGGTGYQGAGYGGGGASDVRRGGDKLSSRVLVAGAGGGTGGEGYGYNDRSAPGGKGGGLVGGDGSGEAYKIDGGGGFGGTQHAGGIGGDGGVSDGNTGLDGSRGKGGQGGSGCEESGYCGLNGGGGGGGGGYLGGGGGGSGGSSGTNYGGLGGGGGGGSSYVERTATSVHMWQGWKRSQHGLIVFSW